MTKEANLAIGIPIAFETKGIVLLARGFTSSTKISTVRSPSLLVFGINFDCLSESSEWSIFKPVIANCTFISPRTLSSLAIAFVCLLISSIT